MKSTQEYITISSNISMGKPVIKGTRLSVDFLLDLLASGLTPQDILKRYPHLKKKQLDAALKYAASSMRNLRIHLQDGWLPDPNHEIADR